MVKTSEEVIINVTVLELGKDTEGINGNDVKNGVSTCCSTDSIKGLVSLTVRILPWYGSDVGSIPTPDSAKKSYLTY